MDPLKLIKIAEKLDKLGKYNDSDLLVKLSQQNSSGDPSLIDPSLVSNSHEEFTTKLWQFGTKYNYSNLADDSWANRQRVLRARDNISTIINRLGNNLVRGHTIDVSLGKC